jgi:hypothetical protein
MFAHIVHPTPIVLDVINGVRREPVRSPEFRIKKFVEEFDDSTLSFDAFFDAAGTTVIFVCPSFFNLLPFIDGMTVTALPAGSRCAYRITNLDRHSRIWVTVPPGTRSLRLETKLGVFEVTPKANLLHAFDNKRVLWTLSKNNRLEWIADWVRFNRDIHGANAVLIYDNASTAYGPQDLLQALSEIRGIDSVAVVVWPFKYGPQGFDAKRFWDSDFCSHGAMEHARWFALQKARSALNSDIDELVMSDRNLSVFEAAERSRLGATRYNGVWVYGSEGKTRRPTEQSPLRFTDFDHYLRPQARKKFGLIPALDDACPTKWVVVPSRCPVKALWTAHRIKNWIGGIPKTQDFLYRHYREITTNWKYDRATRAHYPQERFERDALATSNFNRVDWKA